MPVRNIGIPGIKPPEKKCDDPNCPFHGTLSVRGIVLEGVIVSDKMDKTVIVEREYLRFIKKYKRYERRRSRIPAHNPPCINAEKGDLVKIAETRPISKTVSFVVIQVVKKGVRG